MHFNMLSWTKGAKNQCPDLALIHSRHNVTTPLKKEKYGTTP